MKEIHHITENGLKMFEENFGFPSQTFIACNYVMPRERESTIFRAGVDLIQGQRGELLPSADWQTLSIRRSYTGQRNALGQYYSVRNVKFEPFEDRSRDWVASTLSEIRQAFFLGKPAIVSTHRANYVGGMDIDHRDCNLFF